MTNWIVANLVPPAITLAFIVFVLLFVLWIASRDYNDSNKPPY